MKIPAKVFSFFPAEINSETMEITLVHGAWQNGLIFEIFHRFLVSMNKKREQRGLPLRTFPVRVKEAVWKTLSDQVKQQINQHNI